MSEYSALFEPINLGPVEIKNRIFQSPYTTGFMKRYSRIPHEKEIHHRIEKAKGGFGLIINEASEIHPTSDYTPMPFPAIHNPEALSDLKRLGKAVHEHGTKIFLQAWHGGQRVSNLGSRLPTLAASGLPDHMVPHTPKEMDHEDIKEIQGAFANAAEIAREAGWDGVEFHATHGYLGNQFISPFYNRRTDEYGGSLENRIRFVIESLEKMQKKVSNKMAVGIRLVADEKVPGGLTPPDSAEIAQILVDEGLVDYLFLSTGTYHSTDIWIAGTSRAFDENYQVESIVQVKEEMGGEVPVPVLGAGRIKDPDSAREIVEKGQLDMVGLARQSVADPHWPRKIREDRVEQIRECIGCNKCLSNLTMEKGYMACTQNPTMGKEKEWPFEEFDEADEEKMILVVGAGPAGMEFGIVAANRGHFVHVNEAEKETGGRVRLESNLPNLSEWDRIRDYRERRLEDLESAELHLNAEMDYDSIREYGADIVVLATGSNFDRKGVIALTQRPLSGWDKDHVLIPEDIILNGAKTGDKVVVIDEWGYIEGIGIAEHLASEGKEVSLLTPKMTVGERCVWTGEVIHSWQQLVSLNVQMENQVLPLEIGDDSVTGLKMIQREVFEEEADNVVLSTCRMPNDELYRQLRPELEELREETEIEDVIAVGDCVSVKDTMDAIYDAHRVARGI